MEILQPSGTAEPGSPEVVPDNEYKNEDGRKPTQKRETYYGLHWRKELNWRAMCFEFVDNENNDLYDGQDGIEGIGDYHA
jgi:tRNA-specific adenosine deaminase 3